MLKDILKTLIEGELSARAEFLALKGDSENVIMLFSQAGVGNIYGKIEQARNDARIDQLCQLTKNDYQY